MNSGTFSSENECHSWSLSTVIHEGVSSILLSYHGNRFCNFLFLISLVFLANMITGEGFASGTIDLGGLQVCQISSFKEIWATQEGGLDNRGATFFEPSPMPEGYFMLASYSQPNNKSLFGWVLVGKDITSDRSDSALKLPVDYTLVWSSESLKIKQDGNGYIWLPTPLEGYKSVGYVVTSSPEKPPLEKI